METQEKVARRSENTSNVNKAYIKRVQRWLEGNGFKRTNVWKITRPEIQEKASEEEGGEEEEEEMLFLRKLELL